MFAISVGPPLINTNLCVVVELKPKAKPLTVLLNCIKLAEDVEFSIFKIELNAPLPVPYICNFWLGDVVPIPTLPAK